MKLVGHEEVYPKEWLESITEAAKRVLSHFPKESRLSTRDFVKVLLPRVLPGACCDSN